MSNSVPGYKTLSPAQLAAITGCKQLEERLLRQLDVLREGTWDNGEGVSFLLCTPRELALARTHIEDGFMWLTRSIARPMRIALPEDEPHDDGA